MRLLLTLILAAGTAMAEETRPFVFTPAHNNTVQPVIAGVPVQVQLPAGPVDWHIEKISQNARLNGKSVFASPGRVPGSVAVQVFDFELAETRRAVIVIRPSRTRRMHRRTGMRGRAFTGVFTLTLEPRSRD